MTSESKIPLHKRVMLFLGRFRKLPAIYWAVLAAIFGVADFLTWSVLGDIPPRQRLQWTIGIAIGALLVTVVAVLRRPTIDERMAHARALERMAREAYNAGNYVEAEGHLRKAVQLDPEEVGAWGLLGRTLVRLGKYAEAIRPLTRAIELTQVNRALYLHNRGVAYAMLGQYGRALDDFEESLKERPSRHRTLRWRAMVWFYLGRLDNALKDATDAVELRPHYVCGHATKAIILYELGQIVDAENTLAHCESLLPDDADEFYCLSLAYSRLKGPEQTLQALRIAIERDTKYRARAQIEPLFDRLRENPQFREIVFQTSYT